MNIQSINSSFKNSIFGSSAQSTTKNKLSHRISTAVPLATLIAVLGVTGCDKYEGSVDSPKTKKPNTEMYSTKNEPLTQLEFAMITKAQKIAGPYYDVKYDKEKENIVLTARDFSKNEYFAEEDCYPYDMAALKYGFALTSGVLRSNNTQLDHLYKSILNNQPKADSPQEAIDNNEEFFCKYGDLDQTILLHGKSLIIPLNEIGKKPRGWRQSEHDFDIFREVVEQNKVK